MEFAPAHIRLYVGLLRNLAISLFRFGWKYEYQTLPDRYLIEAEPGLFAVRKDLEDILPERDVIFSDGDVSWFWRTADMLCRLGICRSLGPNKYLFCIDWKDFDGTIVDGRKWEVITLSEVAGAYFDRNEWMVEIEPVVVSGPNIEVHREIMRLFCAAGFAHEKGNRFFWTCEEIELEMEGHYVYWRGAEDSAGNRF